MNKLSPLKQIGISLASIVAVPIVVISIIKLNRFNKFWLSAIFQYEQSPNLELGAGFITILMCFAPVAIFLVIECIKDMRR